MPKGSLLLGADLAAAKPGLNNKTFTVTLAELNAGKILIPAFGAVKFKVVDFSLIPNGTFITATDIRLASTEGTPVVIATLAIAQATDDNYVGPDSTGITLGAGFQVDLAGGFGVQLIKTGSDAAGGTDILVNLSYEIADGVYPSSN